MEVALDHVVVPVGDHDLVRDLAQQRIAVSPIRSSRGALVGCIETLEDITERKTTEQILIDSERILHSVLEGFSIAAFVIDKSGVVQYSEQTPTPKELPNFAKVKETLAKLN